MCGFLGVIGRNDLPPGEIDFYRKRSSRLSTRGNTSQGEYVHRDTALFHYRLAFRGLASGGQPMLDPLRKRILIYNGELYSYRELRARLDYPFVTESDTEVLLAAWHARGENMLEELDGEYAFGIWDPAAQRLTLGRDPFGIKPLYFASPALTDTSRFRTYSPSYKFTIAGDLQFASEMKGLPLALKWEREGFTRQFVGLYEEIATPFQGVIQIPPGSLLIAERKSGEWQCRIERKVEKRRLRSRNAELDPHAAARELRPLLRQSVRERLDAEVPLGAYLSGGVDSRVVAHEMRQAGYEFSSFTVGFEGADYDESQAVRDFVGSRRGIKGHLLRTANAALDYSYPHAVFASEIIQPYTNGSAKWWLSRFARRYVRGVLTGDGADELFCGYPSYRYAAWWDFYSRRPSEARARLYAARLGEKSAKPWETGLSSDVTGGDLKRSAAVLGWEHPLFWQIETLSSFLLGGPRAAERWLRAAAPSLASYVAPDRDESALLRWQNYFLHTHFPTHVLNWVGDRMEMANTLEGRPPLLSQPILKFIRTLPDHCLVRGLRDKAVLRLAYAEELREWALAPKKQFNAPFLYEGELGKKYLDPANVERVGLIPAAAIAAARAAAADTALDPMRRSYARIFLQNSLVTHLLDDYLVRGNDPVRDLDWEEKFLDERTETF